MPFILHTPMRLNENNTRYVRLARYQVVAYDQTNRETKTHRRATLPKYIAVRRQDTATVIVFIPPGYRHLQTQRTEGRLIFDSSCNNSGCERQSCCWGGMEWYARVVSYRACTTERTLNRRRQASKWAGRGSSHPRHNLQLVCNVFLSFWMRDVRGAWMQIYWHRILKRVTSSEWAQRLAI